MPVVKVQGIYLATCTRCNQTWAATKPNPTKCAKCGTYLWNKERKKPK